MEWRAGIRQIQRLSVILALATGGGVWSCAPAEPGLLVSPSTEVGAEALSGYIVISSIATAPSTGPGVLSLVSPDGQEQEILRDYYSSSEFATGTGYLGNGLLVVGVDGSDRLETINLLTGVVALYSSHASITATPLRQLAVSEDGSVFIAESNGNTIEKIDGSGARVGNPFIATTVGSCSLTSPYGVAYNPVANAIAVISSAASGRFSVYDVDAGSCTTHVTAAPFNAGTPAGIAYHPPTGKFIVTFTTTHTIYAVAQDGTSPTLIYQNSGIINTPRAIACDSDGFIYVSSEGTDTIEKLAWSGSGSATRALAGPLVGPSVLTQNVTSITVIP